MWHSVKALLLRQTSVRLNLSSNLVSKVLIAAIGLACVPVYIRVLGVAGYGVIGIWITLETMANILDLGLSPTMTRELAATARLAEEAQNVRDLVRTMEVIYWTIGLFIGVAIVLGAPLIAAHWLQSSQLSAVELRSSVQFIGVLILFRWPTSFYSSGLIGLERQVLLSWMGFLVALLRSLGAVLVLVFVSPTLVAFLTWQIAINIANTATVEASLWWSLPKGHAPRVRPKLLTRVWKFAGGVTANTLVSMLLTDLDKLVVSGLVSLENFGYYMLASRVAGVSYIAAGSVYAAVYPALVRLVAEHNEVQLAALYHRAAQVLSLLVFPAAITGALFAKPLIFAWTGNQVIADSTALIASLSLMGTAFQCILFLPNAAQKAYGWISLAFWTNLAYVPIATVLLIVLTRRLGGEGAAIVWLLVTTSYFVTQVPLMHRKILSHQARQWYVNDVGMPLLACSSVAGLLAYFIEPATTRIGAALTVALAGLLVGAVGLLATPLVRKQLRDLWTQYHARTNKIRP
jgi:O-antigen/teichoic acid export membrane protein